VVEYEVKERQARMRNRMVGGIPITQTRRLAGPPRPDSNAVHELYPRRSECGGNGLWCKQKQDDASPSDLVGQGLGSLLACLLESGLADCGTAGDYCER
jgi:hypothetical protein